MNLRSEISFSNRLSWREFEAEMWRLYFGFAKGLLMAISSFLYFFMLLGFVIVQTAAFAAGKFAEWVTDWNPQKPQVFEMRSAGGD
jgi:hypothetical protein